MELTDPENSQINHDMEEDTINRLASGTRVRTNETSTAGWFLRLMSRTPWRLH